MARDNDRTPSTNARACETAGGGGPSARNTCGESLRGALAGQRVTVENNVARPMSGLATSQEGTKRKESLVTAGRTSMAGSGCRSKVTMIEAEVRSESIRTLYRQTTPVLITNLLNAGIVGAVLWGVVSKARVIGWVTAMACVVLARAGLYRCYRKVAPAPTDAARWGSRYAAGSMAAGMLWGAAGYCLPAYGTASSQLVMFVIAGMCAAAAATTACHPPAFQAFALPALTGLALRMIHFGDSKHMVMAAMIVIFEFGLTSVARLNHRVLTESFTLRFENERLVKEIKSTQEQLEQTNRTLEQRVLERTDALRVQSETLRNAQRMEAVGRLAGGVAHDFNNLLTIILANLSELIGRHRSKRESAQALAEIRAAAIKGADLVRQLLMFSRRQRTIPKTLDLNNVVRATNKLLYRMLGDRHTLQLNLHVSPLPVCADPTQIEQLIVNLVTNARDAMTNGGVVTIATSTVTLTEPTDVLESGAYALLMVTDTGSGMDTETQQLIFDPFFTTKEVGKGTGLGLATVYGIVQQSGGDIRVTSEVNRGSSFLIYLPQVRATALPASSDSATHRLDVVSLPPDASAATILLVEDEPMVRNVAKRILGREGFRILAAESAERALALAAEYNERIDLVITDVIMSGMGGPQLAEQMRAARPGIRTLLMSGYSRDQASLQDDPARGAMFLAKPFTNDLLVAKVKELLAAPARDVQVPAA